jgi:hypothetical protein
MALAVTACYQAPVRTALAVTPQAGVTVQAAGGDVRRTSDPSATLTITTDVGTTTVDALDDSATAKAIRSLITPHVPELKVESSASGGLLRLGAVSALGDYTRLFVIDGVPMADGFRLTIRTRTLARIDVFDDATSKGPYGPRATNGVVLISTSRPH